MALTVEIVAPDRVLWKGQASFVSAPSVEGSLGLLPGHEPLLSLLGKGTVKVTPTGGGEWTVDITRGFVSFDHNNVTLVARPVVPSAEA